jgi:hypothetical protein
VIAAVTAAVERCGVTRQAWAQRGKAEPGSAAKRQGCERRRRRPLTVSGAPLTVAPLSAHS